ncbi:MAG: AMP-binding protein [Candidatus Woesearchaeota archaeon]
MSFWEIEKIKSNKISIIDTNFGLEFSYNELSYYVDELCEKLNRYPKSLILVLTDNSAVTLMIYLAALKSNHAVMLLDFNLDPELLHSIINDYKVNFILTSKKTNIIIGKIEEHRYDKILYYLISVFHVEEDDIFKDLKLLLSTSGSTGSAKFVKLISENLQSNAQSIVEYLNLRDDEIVITSLPFNYSFGLSVINTHLLVGATIVFTDKSVIQKDFWEIFNKYKCSSFAGVPYTYQILQKLKFPIFELKSLKYFTQAGGHLNTETKKYFLEYAQKNNKKFIVMYGQTEATARISYVPFEKLAEKIDSIGIPIPGGKLKIFDNNNEITTSNIVGEIVYEGKNVMLGYAVNRQSLALGDEMCGVLKTGDLGKFDEDGFFYVTGRIKRFLKVFGNRISLDELERILENEFKHPFAVTGIDDKIFILGEGNFNSGSVINFVSKKINIHHSVFSYKNHSIIPLKDNGKKDYEKIMELF